MGQRELQKDLGLSFGDFQQLQINVLTRARVCWGRAKSDISSENPFSFVFRLRRSFPVIVLATNVDVIDDVQREV